MVNVGAMPVDQPLRICTTLLREAGVTRSALTCSFVSYAEPLLQAHPVNLQKLPWVGATRYRTISAPALTDADNVVQHLNYLNNLP